MNRDDAWCDERDWCREHDVPAWICNDLHPVPAGYEDFDTEENR